jgi:NADPH:quinone reductase-like Zn-dependent oxidoreductase/malonyl CoA-acyl carrier protein transacylase
MLHKGFILPNANFEKANDAIPFEEYNLKVPTSTRPWPRNKRFISVNNFGFGGSNVHAVLGKFQPPPTTVNLPDTGDASPRLFVLSANDEASAKSMVTNLSFYIEQHPEVFLKHLPYFLSYTLGQRRTHHQWRIAFTASSCYELGPYLSAPDARPSRALKSPKIAFVYTGQGAQWAQMGRELMTSHPVFANTINAAATILSNLGAEFSLVEELSKSKDESDINLPHISQPLCTALQLALTDLLSSWGVRPSAVTGHSSGEIAAAYSTGAITLEEAMAAAYHRGHVASKIKVEHPKLRGGMLAVGAGPTEVRAIIKSASLSGVDVACENSPNSVTVSGDESTLDELAVLLEAQGLFNRKLRVDVAYHSFHMQLGADEYMGKIKSISPKLTDGVEFFSSLRGQKLESTLSLDSSYWVGNLVEPVRFSSALQALYTDVKPNVIVEIGPHSALEGPIKQILKGISREAASHVKYCTSLVRNQNATVTALNLAGTLFVGGHGLDFEAVNRTGGQELQPVLLTDLSPYPWSHQKYWSESRISNQHRHKPFPRHDLLGLLEDAYNDTEPTWRNIISSDDIPWLTGHKMQSLTTFPLAGYVCMAVEAASQRNSLRGIPADQIAGFRLREVQASKAFILDSDAQYETLVSLKAYSEGPRSYSKDWDVFTISSWISGRGWLEHCRGLISISKVQAANPVNNSPLQAAITRRQNATFGIENELSVTKFYEELESHGAGYNSVFTLPPGSSLRTQGDYSTCNVTVPDTASIMPYTYETPSKVPVAFMDLFLHLVFPILGAGRDKMQSLFMPSSIKELEISCAFPNQPGDQVQVVAHGNADFASPGAVDFFIDAWHPTQPEPIAKITEMRMTPIHNDVEESQSVRSLCYGIDWVPLDSNGNVIIQNGEHANGEKVIASGHAANGDVTNGHTNGDVANGEKVLTNGHATYGHVANGHVANGHSTSLGSELVLVTDRSEENPLVSALANLIELRTAFRPAISPFSHVEISSSARYIFLTELDAPILHNMSTETFDRLKKLLTTCSSIIWVTAGAYRFSESPESNISQGILRTLRSEMNSVAATMDLDPESQLKESDHAKLILQAMESSCAVPEDDSPVDYEFTEEHGRLVVPRVVEREDMNLAHFRATQSTTPYSQDFNQPGRRLKVAVGTFGALDSIYWKDEPEQPLANDEVEIKIAFTGMNFKDVVIAMGQVASPYLGVECSGTISRIGSQVKSLKIGDRVCAMSLGAYGTYTRCPATSAAVIPDGMDLDIAASVPVVYSTAYYGIIELARLQSDETILIHAAAGGVGQAAIQLAQSIGARIFVTVGSHAKKQFLMDTYSIDEDHIFYSRDTSFGPAVREATGGRGVDVVINSLAGDLLRESWQSLASFGRFIEIGKRDITSNTGLEMSKFEQNCTFSSVDLTLVSAERPRIMGRVLNTVMTLLAKKTVSPIMPISRIGLSEVETALRNLQSGRSSGKVVVNHLVNEQVKVCKRNSFSLFSFG